MGQGFGLQGERRSLKGYSRKQPTRHGSDAQMADSARAARTGYASRSRGMAGDVISRMGIVAWKKLISLHSINGSRTSVSRCGAGCIDA